MIVSAFLCLLTNTGGCIRINSSKTLTVQLVSSQEIEH